MFDSRCERVDLFGKLAEENVLGCVREHQHDVHVSWPQLHQVTYVSDICQLRHLHEILFGRPTETKRYK